MASSLGETEIPSELFRLTDEKVVTCSLGVVRILSPHTVRDTNERMYVSEDAHIRCQRAGVSHCDPLCLVLSLPNYHISICRSYVTAVGLKCETTDFPGNFPEIR